MRSGVWFCIVVMIFFSCKTRSLRAPFLEVNNDSMDIGTIKLHDSARLKYWLYNLGEGALKIKNVGTSCGCSRAYAGDSLLKPGDSSALHIGFKATDTGFIKKHIVIETNAEPVYKTLVFTGYVANK